MVKMRGSGLDGSKSIHLFIYPENIHTVTADELLDTLTVSLKRPPGLVVPKRRPLESEPATDTLLVSMFALAKATHIDVQLSTMPRKTLEVYSLCSQQFLGQSQLLYRQKARPSVCWPRR
ncbi:hypothetical protein J3F83DRAFT_634341 [Trichoderma novae-zelandiae]